MRYTPNEVKTLMSAAGLSASEFDVAELISVFSHIEVFLDRAQSSWSLDAVPAHEFDPVAVAAAKEGDVWP